jgi:hypothetical protein
VSILTQLKFFAEMCRRLEIDEIVFDQEEYPGPTAVRRLLFL